MTKFVEEDEPCVQPGGRKKIGLIDTEPQSFGNDPDGLTPQQLALREAVINNFKSNKMKAYIAKQVEYVNASRQIGEGVRFLLDSSGNPPANLPLEEIIENRQKIEGQIRWLEAICSELKLNLSLIKEIEESAFELIAQNR